MRRATLAFIFIVVALDILAFGIIIPVLPHLIREFNGGDTVQAAYWVGLFGTVFALVQFVCAPIQGALSDRYGRRPVILLSCLGLGLDFILMAVAWSLPVLLIGRILSGMTAASFSAANAYIADVTPPEKRAGAYGLLGAAFGLGFILGPALGGFLGGIDIRLPFWFAAGLALINFVYGLFVLPESLPRERRAPLQLKQMHPLGALLRLRRYPQVFGLAMLSFVQQLAHYVFPATFVLYADYRYGWGEQTVGYVLAAVGLCHAIVQAGLAGRIVAALGERRTLLLGLSCGTLGFVAYGVAPSGLMFLLAIPIMSLWGLANPAAQAMMTRQVAPEEQGRLQGAVSGAVSVAGIFGPMLFASVFASAIGTQAHWQVPGAAFLLSGLLLAGGLLFAWRITRASRDGAPVLQTAPPLPVADPLAD